MSNLRAAIKDAVRTPIAGWLTGVFGLALMFPQNPAWAEPKADTSQHSIRMAQAATYEPRQRSRQEQVCQHYERQLANNWVQGRATNYQLPELEDEIEKVDRRFNQIRAQTDRHKCYTSFLIFGKHLRNTRRCHRLDRQLKKVEARLTRLHRRREKIKRPQADSGRRAQIIQKLAQNRCGAQYTREAKRYSFFWWGEDSSGGYDDRDSRGNSTISPYATYRTMCVRMCDGFYFPISFSTLSSRFSQDDVTCQQKCAAPARLFVYRNPGETVEQMTSWEDGQNYEMLENAFRYRREFVKGCSCKPDEYQAELLALRGAGERAVSTQSGGSDAPGIDVDGVDLKPNPVAAEQLATSQLKKP